MSIFHYSGVLWVLIVSSIDLSESLHALTPSAFLESSKKGLTLNLTNDYRYLKTGYYVSLHAEVLGNRVIPASEDIIDASRTPILLLRAKRANIPTIPFIVTDNAKKIAEEVGFPAVIFAVNPFIYEGYQIAKNKSALYRALKSLGMNYKFAVCAQPLKGEICAAKSVFGKTDADSQIRDIAQRVYDLFKIPLCKLHIQKTGEGAFLCGLEPLKDTELSNADKDVISREILLISQQEDHFSV